jgi:hypothetical protein
MTSCTYTVGDKNTSGDNFYAPFLNDDQRSYFWNAYGFSGNKDYWVNGWGWDDDANTDKALARTFNACWALTYSAFDYPSDGYDNNIILNWARRYVRDKMDDLQAHCGSNPFAIATTYTGPFTDDRTELYLSFFYSNSVVERTGVMVHESRHYDVGHDANFPPWSVLANAGQGQQADSSWGYNGAYRYEVAYLAWYHAAGVAATPAMRDRARQRANWCLNNAFAAHPGFTISEDAAPQAGWRWCNRCQGLSFAGGGEIGKCPAGGAHNHAGSYSYTLIRVSYAAGQNGWKWCNKCQGLSFSGNASQGACPAGGHHDHGGSADYCMLPGGNRSMCQRGWRWCDKCQGLAYSGNGGGSCPAGGSHHFPSGDYSLPFIEDFYPAVQSEWRWCNKCQGLAFAPNGTGHCPAGGGHNHDSWNYSLYFNAPSLGQDAWRWCNKCQGLSFGGSASQGPCPAGGQHNHAGSGNYTLAHDAPNMGQEGWRWCNKCQGLAFAPNGAGHCPAGGGHNHDSWAYGLPFTR